MGRGLGQAQRQALELLSEDEGLRIDVVAEKLGVSARRTRAIVGSLRDRELVWTRTWSWREHRGEKGKLARRMEDYEKGDPCNGPVTEETPGAVPSTWDWDTGTGYVPCTKDHEHITGGECFWAAPSGIPVKNTWVFLGDPPEPSTMLGRTWITDRYGRQEIVEPGERGAGAYAPMMHRYDSGDRYGGHRGSRISRS